MKKLNDMLIAYQTTNLEKKGIKFTEEEFTELYDKINENFWKHVEIAKFERVRGILIGAGGAGLVGLGIKGINKIRKRKLIGKTNDELGVALDEVEAIKSELKEIDEKLKNVRIVSQNEMDTLTAIIDEINDHEKKAVN